MIAEDSVRFAHSGPSTQSTSSRYCGTRILLAPPPSPREREGPSDISYRVAKRSSDRTLARRPCLEMPRWHPRVAKGSSDRSSARQPCLQVPQSHPRVTKGGFLPVFGTATLPTGTSETSPRGEEGFWTVFGTATLPTGTSGSSPRGKEGLRHGDPTHRYLSDIPAWRRGLLDGLRHGDLACRCLSGIPAWRRSHLSGLRHGDPTYR